MIGADDGGHQVAAKRRTRLLQQPVSVSIESTVQSAVRPVCRRTATPGRQLAAKKAVAPYRMASGFALGYQIADQPGVNLRIVLAQALVATGQDLVCTGANQMLESPREPSGPIPTSATRRQPRASASSRPLPMSS